MVKIYQFQYGDSLFQVVTERVGVGEVIRLPEDYGYVLLQVIEVIGSGNHDSRLHVAQVGLGQNVAVTHKASFLRIVGLLSLFTSYECPSNPQDS